MIDDAEPLVNQFADTNFDDGFGPAMADASHMPDDPRCPFCWVPADTVEGQQTLFTCDFCQRVGCVQCLPMVQQDSGELFCCQCVLQQAAQLEQVTTVVGPVMQADTDPEMPDLEADSDDEYDADRYETILRQAQSLPKPATMPVPWESGWLGLVMGKSPEPLMRTTLPRPGLNPMQEGKPAVTAVPSATVGASSSRRANRCGKRKLEDWKTQIQNDRQSAIGAWLNIARLVPAASKLGRQIIGLSEDDAMMVVQDTFEDKATSTLNSRAYSINQFVRWHQGLSTEPVFPVTEEAAYRYAVHLRSTHAPATRAGRFRQALAFAGGTMLLEMDADAVSSRRAAGASLASFKTKRFLKQRRPLTVLEVESLEKLVLSSEDLVEVVVNGNLLFGLHTRSRYSDLNGIDKEPEIDGDYVEAETGKHKTSNLPQRRHRWLPLVGLSHGVSGGDWAARWIEARCESGLQAGPNVPFMPVPRADGTWTNSPMSIGEATLRLRESILKVLPSAVGLEDVGTHSLKATLLSWSAKAGLDALDRKFLGGHLNKSDLSMVAYSRDTLAGPLRSLRSMVQQIQSRTFLPDSSRSGRFVAEDRFNVAPKDVVPAASGDLEANSQSDETSSSSDSSGSEEADLSSDDAAYEASANVVARRCTELTSKFAARAPAFDRNTQELWRHKTRLTFHLAKTTDGTVLACGRKIGVIYRKCTAELDAMFPQCPVCFGARQ